jgi:TPR repeat protein
VSGAHRLIAAALAAMTLCAAAQAQTSDPERLYGNAYSAYSIGDYEQARTLAAAAAAAGHVRASALAGHLLERGLGGPADDETARLRYEAAAVAGDGDALFALGLMARDGRAGLTPQQAEDYFRGAAEAGREEARVELAMLYADGVLGEPDLGRARVLLGQAALDGSADAQRALGLVLLTQGKAPGEIREAETWLVAAAEAGDVEAAYALGVSYSTGEVLPADDAKAASYLLQAAEAGDPAAAADYGLLVYQGRGAPQSYEAAAEWFRKAAEAGDQEGRTLYAIALAKGEGVARDLEEAYYWALRASALGDSAALNYEVDRFQLIQALEQSLPEEARTRVRNRVGRMITP